MSSFNGHLTPAQGAETPVFLATEENLSDKPNGKFWQNKGVTEW